MKQRGSIFILALILLASITSILAFTVAAQQVSSKASINRIEARRARLMAESGVQRGIAEIALITQIGEVDQSGTWYTLGNQGADNFIVGRDSFRLQIVDAGSLINLNTVPQVNLQNFGLTQGQIDSLLDWREAGSAARVDGAKDDYYNALPKPYNVRAGRMESVDELLLIKDWLPTTVFDLPTNVSTTTNSNPAPTEPLYELATVDSYSPNTTATGQALTNLNTVTAVQLTQAGITQAVATAIIARRTGLGRYTTMAQVLATPGLNDRLIGILLDRFTISTLPRIEGKINLNTAGQDVLGTIPAFTSDIVQALISRQTTGLTSLSQALQVPGLTARILGPIAEQVTVGSDTFVIRSQGRAGQSIVALETVVRIQNGTVIVIKTRETPQPDMKTLWKWPDTTNNDVVLMEVAG